MVGNNFAAKMLRIGSESNKWHVLLKVLPLELSRAHMQGLFHEHDLDSYNLTTNCLHVPLEQLLNDGFNSGYGPFRRPKRIRSAVDLACIAIQTSQNK